ncbi:MAG: outer membrane beta-barrel protein, partial [Alphaproteobacteria bacterium]|nr:outer membrane beta-barrel protein [Alphaproteobacteria bacterium]
AYVGWMSQDYGNFGSNEVNDGVKFGGRLEWNVTGMDTLVLEVSRSIEETTDTNFNSYKATGGSATFTHELLRNVLLEADFGFTRSDYNGIGERQDDNVLAGGGARWLINRYLYSDFIYNWSNRDSDAPGSDYSRHLVTLRLGVQL